MLAFPLCRAENVRLEVVNATLMGYKPSDHYIIPTRHIIFDMSSISTFKQFLAFRGKVSILLAYFYNKIL